MTDIVLLDYNVDTNIVCGSVLDRAFYRGFASGTAVLHPANTRPAEGLDFNDRDRVRTFIQETEGPAFASDHQPLVVTLKIN
ncbi:hypothetical protein VARIO8X_140031 [Burkholderiales bacterium 8X]|nr:hypothetical protein VARIO8X_140031 [Burkholderiales bacterium 8X]